MASGNHTPSPSSDFKPQLILPTFKDLEINSDDEETSKNLVILDLNKVLFWRDSGYPKLLDEVPEKCKDLEAIKVNKGILYLRPHLQPFLDHCYKNYDVGFFTSMMEFNGRLIVENILSKEHFEKTKFIWCRDKCDSIHNTSTIYTGVIDQYLDTHLTIKMNDNLNLNDFSGSPI